MIRCAAHQQLFISFLLCSVVLPSQGFARCLGAATPEALAAFENDPAAFIRVHGTARDIGAQLAALASTAVNLRDSKFGKNLGLALGMASADQGRAIGAALANIGRTCTDALDPADRADKEYLATEIVANIATNQAASTAYGLALDEPQTASIGGGDGGGEGGSSGLGGQVGATSGFNGSSGSDAASATRTTPPSGGSSGGGGGGGNDTTQSTLTFGTVLTGGNSVSAN